MISICVCLYTNPYFMRARKQECLVRQVRLLWRPKTSAGTRRDPIILARQSLSSGWFPSLFKRKTTTHSCFVYRRKPVSKSLETVCFHLYIKTLNGISHCEIKIIDGVEYLWACYFKFGCIHCHKGCIQSFWPIFYSEQHKTFGPKKAKEERNFKFVFFMNKLKTWWKKNKFQEAFCKQIQNKSFKWWKMCAIFVPLHGEIRYFYFYSKWYLNKVIRCCC